MASAQQNTRLELVAAETARSLAEKMEEKFQHIAEGTVETHADLIGTRLNDQLEQRLNLAKETVASLSTLKTEMKSISASLAADTAEEEKTASGLARHSIMSGFK